MNKIYFPLSIFTVFLILCGSIGCSNGSTSGENAEQPIAQYNMAQNSLNDNLSEEESDGSRTKDGSYGLLDKKGDINQAPPKFAENETGAKTETDESKKHVYFGYTRLIVNSLPDTRNAISKLAEESGGYIEASYDTQVIIRIPKDKFNEIFASLLALGEVDDKTIETYDVTEYFQDLEMRLSVAERTRGRLYNLLERTLDVQERLQILKEIKRLSEEIENTKLQIETIKRLIAFSSITIDLIQRLADVSAENKNAIPFGWIARLDPFYPSLRSLSIGISMPLGDEFAVFDNKGYFFAESADGVRVRAGTTSNKPSGDTSFWQKAVTHYLGNLYKSTTAANAGEDVKTILFVSRDSDPYYYFIGLHAKGDTILVIEVFYPNGESYNTKHASVEKGIREMKFK